MSFSIVDVFPIALLALLIYGIRLRRPLHEFNTDTYLSVETCKSFRGLLAIIVVLHHLAQNTVNDSIYSYIISDGFLVVAFFFFLSGYGLQSSYISKGDKYKKGFILKRIPPVLIPYIIITVLYWLMYLAGGDLYTLKDIIIGIVKGNTIVPYSWYIVNILEFYIIYWLLMIICKKNYALMIAGALIWYILYAAFCMRMSYGVWWYKTSLLPAVGMFWATYEKRIIEIVKRRYFIITPIVFTALLLLVFWQSDTIPFIVPIAKSSLFIVISKGILFVICVLMFSMKFQIGNKALRFLGEISLEIYLSQGLFIKLLRSDWVYIGNDFLRFLAVLTLTIVFSFFLHKAFRFILKKNELLMRNKVRAG